MCDERTTSRGADNGTDTLSQHDADSGKPVIRATDGPPRLVLETTNALRTADKPHVLADAASDGDARRAVYRGRVCCCGAQVDLWHLIGDWMKAYVARDWDGRLTMFRGNRPVELVHDSGVTWQCGDGTAVQCVPHRDLYKEVRCGECRELVAVDAKGAA